MTSMTPEITNTELPIKRSPLFEEQNPSSLSKNLKILTDLTTKVPGLTASLWPSDKLVVDVPTEIAKKIKDGTLEFLNTKNGTMAAVRNANSKKIVKHLKVNTELIGPAVGPAMLALGLFVEMKKIQNGIDNLNKGITDVLQNFENDRYARAFAAKEKLEQAQLVSDEQTKKMYLMSILSDVTNTKHMLYKQLTDKVSNIINNKKIFNDKSKTQQANESLQNLFLFNEAFKVQIQCYTELEEYYALSHALDAYNKEIKTVFTKEVQLSVDGYFDNPSNPFSHAITELLANVTATNDYLVENKQQVLEYAN